MADNQDYTKQMGPPLHVNTPQESEALDLSYRDEDDASSAKATPPAKPSAAFPDSDCAHTGGYCGR